jgi:hypothetical protein
MGKLVDPSGRSASRSFACARECVSDLLSKEFNLPRAGFLYGLILSGRGATNQYVSKEAQSREKAASAP